MKLILPFILLMMTTVTLSGQSVRVMTYNLRFDNPGDGINQWSSRKEKVFNLLQKYQPDIVGTQEALQHQLTDITTHLSTYAYIGVGRDDGNTKGEYSAILYNQEKFEVLEHQTFWLSLTPEVAGSKSWDAAITRVATWAKFKDKKTGKKFFILNTHFDHMGSEARLQSAALIKRRLNALADNLPVIVTGDFNCEPIEEPYLRMTAPADFTLKDAGDGSTTGTYCTFAVAGPPCKRIDYIFYSVKWKASAYLVITDHDGVNYPSDHLPVMCTFVSSKK